VQNEPLENTEGSTRLVAQTLLRARRSIRASYAAWVIGLLVPVLMVPMLVRFLGHGLYGQWVVILSLTSYFGLANLGMGQTVGNMVAEAVAKDQTRFLGQVVSTVFFFHVLIAMPLLVVSLLLALGYFVPFLPLHTDAAEIALSVACAFAALSLPLKVSSMTLRSLNRVDLEQATQAISNLVRAAAMIGVLLAGLKLIAVAAVHGLALIVSGIAAYAIVNRACTEARPRMGFFSWALLKQMLLPSAGFFVLTVASTLAFSIDNLVIAYNLGLRAVTQYAVPFQVVMLVVGFFAVALGAVTPVVTDHHARGANDVLSRAYIAVVRAAILYGMSAVTFLWLAGPSLLRLWAGHGVFPGNATLGLQFAFLFIQVLLYPASTILIATSKHHWYAVWALVEGALNLTLSLWWVHLWGMPGVIAGTVAARLLTNGWYMPAAALRVLRLSAHDFLTGICKSVVLGIVGLILAMVASIWWPISAGTSGIAIACTVTLVFIGIFLAMEPTSQERQWLVQAVCAGRNTPTANADQENTA
jgi:O-antigen/teichoic acid export membrane protein